MKKQNWILFAVTLALIGSGAAFLEYYRTHQRLGQPGVKTQPLAGGKGLEVVLPAQVLDYESVKADVDDMTRTTLPQDTSYGQRRYHAPDGFELQVNVVLMGGDRTSLHKPQFCLESQGWRIDGAASVATQLTLDRYPFNLPVVKLAATREVNGRSVPLRAVYVYWYVADGAVSASVNGFERMWWMARDLLRTGVLQRWAYVSCLAFCEPGQEEATFERMKKFITASAPEFLLTPSPSPAVVTARP